MRAALLEVRDEARQVRVEQRLADPVQHRSVDPRELVDDPPELRPGQVMLGLERQKVVVGQRARGAQRVAAVGHLDVDLLRQFGRDSGAGLERYHRVRSVSYGGAVSISGPCSRKARRRCHARLQDTIIRQTTSSGTTCAKTFSAPTWVALKGCPGRKRRKLSVRLLQSAPTP